MKTFIFYLILFLIGGLLISYAVIDWSELRKMEREKEYELHRIEVKLNYCQIRCEAHLYSIYNLDEKSFEDCLSDCLRSNEFEEVNQIGSYLYE